MIRPNDQLTDLRRDASNRDAADPMTSFRDEFHIPREPGTGNPVAYFCGNSLGLQPRSLAGVVAEELERWASLAVDGHFSGPAAWYSCHEVVAAQLAPIVGALPVEVAAMGTLTANLHQLLVSFYRPTPERYRFVIEAGAFPSDRYVVATQARFHGLDPADAVVELGPRPGSDLIDEADVETWFAEHGHTVACVLLGGVHYRTGQAFDRRRVIAAARKAGAVVGLDLAHAAGNLELDLHDEGPDFAAWCSYKYLNSGPGGLAGIFVAERHADRTDLHRFGGWWGNDPATRFLMPDVFVPQRGAAGWIVSNTPVLTTAALRASLAIFNRATMPRLRARSVALTGFAEQALHEVLGEEAQIITPADPTRRGAQLSIRIHSDAKRAQRAMQALGVVTDFRTPDVIRIAPAPLYNSYRDIVHAVEALRVALHGES